MRTGCRWLLLTLAVAGLAAPATDLVVVDFEGAIVLQAGNDKANRAEQFEEKGVVFKLAHEPRSSKAKGLVMYFEHLSNGHKGIGSGMALESIAVRANFARPVSSVTVSFWGSAGAPALLEAFDAEGKAVDRAALSEIPGRKSPGDPVPFFTLAVRGQRIAYVQFSGPRPGEYLAADELRFTPAVD